MFDPINCVQSKMIHVFKQGAVHGDYCKCGDVKYEPASITTVKNFTECSEFLHMFEGTPKPGDTCKCGAKPWQTMNARLDNAQQMEQSLRRMKALVNHANQRIAEQEKAMAQTPKTGEIVAPGAPHKQFNLTTFRESAQKQQREASALARRKMFSVIKGGKDGDNK